MGWSVATQLTVSNFYYLFLALLGGVLATVILVVNSRIGYALHSYTNVDAVANPIGIRTIKYNSIA